MLDSCYQGFTFDSKYPSLDVLFIYLFIFLHMYSYKTLRRTLQIWNTEQRCVYDQP